MPSRSTENPGAQIEAILRDATDRILSVLTEQIQAELASLRSSLAPDNRPGRPSRATQNARTASPREEGRGRTKEGGRNHAKEGGRSHARVGSRVRTKEGGRGRARAGGRVRTKDVADSLRQVLRARRGGLRVAELREATGFGNMQLHRGLELLVQEGEVTREGALRKTTYHLVSGEPSRKRREPAGKTPERARAPRTEAPHRTPTAEVAQAVLHSLRGRRQGLGMTALRETTGHTRAQLHRALGILLEEGRVRRTGTPPALRYHLRR